MCEVTIFLWNNNIALGNMFAFLVTLFRRFCECTSCDYHCDPPVDPKSGGFYLRRRGGDSAVNY